MGSTRPTLALTLGDPAGIGPEIMAKALAEGSAYDGLVPLVVGDRGVLAQVVEGCGLDLEIRCVDGPDEARGERGVVDLVDLDNMGEVRFGEIDADHGRAALLQRALDHPLALAVGRAWLHGRALVDGDAFRHPEQRRRGRQHEARHPVAHARLNQPDAVGRVLQQVPIRLAHTLAHQRQRREVQHPAPRPGRQHRFHPVEVGQVGHDEVGPGQHRLGEALPQVVQHRDIRAAFKQRRDGVAAHVAGAAGDQVALNHACCPASFALSLH